MDRNIFLKELKKSSEERDIPNITERNAQFLRSLLSLSKAKNILEIWTANGYSTLQFAFEIEKNNGHITTIEFSSETHKEALKNFEEMGVSNMITSLFWNALEILPTLNEQYDFIFIDAMKKHTKKFLELSLPLLKEWWFIVIDDVIKFRHKMEDLYTFIESEKIHATVLPIDDDDGIMLITFN